VTGWCWFALVEGAFDGRLASSALATAAAISPDGSHIGTFAAWPPGRKPVPAALRMDERLIDPQAPPAWVSLVTVPRHVAPLFDDVTVSEAMRNVLRGIPPTAVSTLVRDATTIAGAVTIRRTGGAEALRDDPFARLHPARVLRAGASMFGALPAPAGPAIQRYSGKPWPAPGFEN
jgi:hypothetical protein